MFEGFLEPIASVVAGLLFLLVPVMIAIGLGLVVLGVLRRRYGAAAFGIALPLGTLIAALIVQAIFGVSPPESFQTLTPYSLLFAGIVLLFVVLPGVVRGLRA